jgi:hypothetical protein
VTTPTIFEVEVDCYSGWRGEETPRRLRLGAVWINLTQVLDRWLAPDHRYFKAEGDDGATYILRHDVEKQRWELTMYEDPQCPSR